MTARPMVSRRGRPRKVRPTNLADATSLYDVEAITGVDRRFLARARLVASIPADEFEVLVEADEPTKMRDLEILARGRAGKTTAYVRRCPHCGGDLRAEKAR